LFVIAGAPGRQALAFSSHGVRVLSQYVPQRQFVPAVQLLAGSSPQEDAPSHGFTALSQNLPQEQFGPAPQPLPLRAQS
jgi:hypothetical protein